MLNSSSNRSTSRIGSGLINTSASSEHRRSMPVLFRNHRRTKKQLSLTLNEAEFEFCHAPDENEMLEFVSNSIIQENDSTNPLESTISDDTITDRQQQTHNICNRSPTTCHRKHIISHLKHRLAPHKYEYTKRDENDHEKNNGFLLVDQIDKDLVLISNDNIDQQRTRHAEPCVHGQIDEDNVDINQIQLMSTTPVTPSLLPPPQPSSASSILPITNHSNHDVDVQATQAGIECAAPSRDESNRHDTRLSISDTSSSPSSTNSSNTDPQFTTTDPSTLDDPDYVLEQKRHLDRITVYEIALNNDRRDYQQDLSQTENEELEFNQCYKDALQQNLKLKEEIKRLQEDKLGINSAWACEVCTYINPPYIKTNKNICEMCEGPSPLKRHTLIS